MSTMQKLLKKKEVVFPLPNPPPSGEGIFELLAFGAKLVRCLWSGVSGKLPAASLILAVTLTSGCSGLTRSVYHPPQVALPAQWSAATLTGSAVASGGKWWERFNDPVLDQLIDRALRSNNDLAAATIKVQRARLQSGLTDTNLTPSVTVGETSSVSRDLRRGVNTQAHSVSASLNYELDLWGKLASARDSSSFEAQATEFDRQGTALSLIGTTAANYWQIGFLNQRIAISRASIEYAEKTLSLVELRYRSGAVSKVDLLQSRQTLASQRADFIQLEQQRSEARNALAILFDQAPQNAVPEPAQLPGGALPEIEAGLPASLLGQRPDLRAAELRLREFLADRDTARTSYYPSFTLTGSLGGSSTSLVNVLQNPVGVLGAGLALPFVQWNTMQLSVKISDTRYQEAVVNFRQTLYTGLSEVENALSARDRLAAESLQLEEAVALAKGAEQLLEIRYRAGSSGIQFWLDAQETRRTAEKALVENRLNRYKNLMTLYQALGGDTKRASL
jgi:NodT family efflux transporter outer membrane factor (OMF) lipoprotein